MNKFNHWDNKLLFITLQKVLQVKEKIEEICVKQRVPPKALPLSMIPTDALYEITTCYEAMYDALLEKDLLKCGFIKAPPTYH